MKAQFQTMGLKQAHECTTYWNPATFGILESLFSCRSRILLGFGTVHNCRDGTGSTISGVSIYDKDICPYDHTVPVLSSGPRARVMRTSKGPGS